jgi:hypothetical protein
MIAGIAKFVVSYNHEPKPFDWTASANAIVEQVGHWKVILETQHQGFQRRRAIRW